MTKFGGQYCECVGTKKEQRAFSRKEYFNHLWTWAAYGDEQGRIHLSIDAPPKSLSANTVRGLFREAMQVIPRVLSGGRPRKVRPNEVRRLRAEIKSLAIERGNLSSALKRIAELEGMDPRTLRTGVGDISPNVQPRVSAEVKKEQESQGCHKRTDQGPPGRHYRRNPSGYFDEVK